MACYLKDRQKVCSVEESIGKPWKAILVFGVSAFESVGRGDISMFDDSGVFIDDIPSIWDL